MFWSVIFILISGLTVFFKFSASAFFSYCGCSMSGLKQDLLIAFHFIDINIPIFAALYTGYKIYNRTKIWKPKNMDFVTVC